MEETKAVKHLLPAAVPYHKANLHTHSIVSDGELTPQQLKQEYKSRGYGILAITDHSVMVDYHHLCDDDFLMINGVEMDIEDPAIPYKTRHLCMLCKDPHLLWLPYRDKDMLPHMIPYFEKCQCEGMAQAYTPEAINAIIAKANEKGFLVTYNHPTWSQESYPDYITMRGLWAMEYRNAASAISGFDEDNSRVYQDLLNVDRKILPVMTDDIHHQVKPNGATELAGAWVMVAAEDLQLDTVMTALQRGDLYSSCGPQIHSLTCDGDNIYITCSPAANVRMMTNTRAAIYRCSPDGTPITEAKLPLQFWKKRNANDPNGFVRITVTAPDGTYAVTRAYLLHELMP